MAKHTPGPWKFEGKRARIPDEARIITYGTGKHLAYALDFNRFDRDEEADANARLIAAAPTMLDALKVIALDPKIKYWLTVHDPMALRQVEGAIASTEEGEG